MFRIIIIKLAVIYKLLHTINDKLEDKEAIVPQDDVLLTINETAAYFSVSSRTIRRWQTGGLIDPIQIGGTVFYIKSQLVHIVKMNGLNKKSKSKVI